MNERPNKAPEPTITAVTPRAPSSTSRASGDRGSSLTFGANPSIRLSGMHSRRTELSAVRSEVRDSSKAASPRRKGCLLRGPQVWVSWNRQVSAAAATLHEVFEPARSIRSRWSLPSSVLPIHWFPDTLSPCRLSSVRLQNPYRRTRRQSQRPQPSCLVLAHPPSK
jgi:hypothetical protein